MKKFGILCALVLLAACSSDKHEPPKDVLPPEPEIRTESLICPQVAIVRAVDEKSDFGGEKPDDSQLVAKAKLKKIEGDCGYRKDESDKTGVDIEFKLIAAAAKGPRLGGDQVSFPYFVALVDPNDNVLSRQIVTARFTFPSDKKVAEIEEPIHVFIPLPVKSLSSGPAYRVLVGFMK